jgi:hypothetical protein
MRIRASLRYYSALLRGFCDAAGKCQGTRPPDGGVAETLLHETAGNDLSYGDLSVWLAPGTGAPARWSRKRRSMISLFARKRDVSPSPVIDTRRLFGVKWSSNNSAGHAVSAPVLNQRHGRAEDVDCDMLSDFMMCRS